MILEKERALIEAILAMGEGIATADLWLIRYQIGNARLRAGSNLEALDELMMLQVRRGEATAVFLDGMPTYRLSRRPFLYPAPAKATLQTIIENETHFVSGEAVSFACARYLQAERMQNRSDKLDRDIEGLCCDCVANGACKGVTRHEHGAGKGQTG